MKKIAKILLLIVVCAMLSGCAIMDKISPKTDTNSAMSSAAVAGR